MKKIMYLFATVCSLPAMEMKEFKKDHQEVSPQLLAAVIKVPAVSKMLAKHYLTCPIDISQATFEDECIEMSNLKKGRIGFMRLVLIIFNVPLLKVA